MQLQCSLCSAGTSAIPAPSSPLLCNSHRPCQPQAPQFPTPFPRAALPFLGIGCRAGPGTARVRARVTGVCWGSPGPEPLGQHSWAVGRAWGVQRGCGGRGLSLGGHPGAAALLKSPLPRSWRDPREPWPGRGFRGCPGSGEVLETAWGRGSLGESIWQGCFPCGNR